MDSFVLDFPNRFADGLSDELRTEALVRRDVIQSRMGGLIQVDQDRFHM